MRISAAFRSGASVLSILLFSCASVAEKEPRLTVTPRPLPEEAIGVQRKLAEGARYVLGRKQLTVNGKSFPMDCSGTVLAIYWYAGIDLARDFYRYSGNAVTRIYRSLEKRNLLYSSAFPLTGDLIFWDNTYDRNGDGEWNDPLTHVGMVLRSAQDGTIEFVHLNYSKGIVVEYMNLLEPDIHRKISRGQLKIVNSPIRLKSPGKRHPPRWLAGQLYRILGMGYLF